ncbi:hypothetical protein Q767_08355 [Flavobacterium enshiense DK69]|uniref:Outer membrane protein beta-barrel domain-containing protein n=2 Tax=Flavobacterium TaxID=237 RepID=A0A0A2MUC2_9FLAO|nr:hypothetical protein Q767_08355 [Flavobacterium enshiense DK69]
MVGGNASFSYSKTESKNNNSNGTEITYSGIGGYTILLEPNVAYFIKNKLAVGSSINYVNSFIEENKLRFDGMNLGISPFVRYYFLDYDKNYNVFLEPSYNHFISENLGNSNGFGLKTGLAFFLNSSVAFETVLKYSKNNSENYINNNIYLGFGLQVHLEKE